jgi:hydrogenase maturation protease
VLVLGIGNPGRRDDGLGPRLAEAVGKEEGKEAGVQAESRYQLGVEDALAVRDFDAVVFADASRAGDDPAALTPIGPDPAVTFTTHALAPAAVLSLCRELYGRSPRAWLLGIRGYDWEVGEGLSEGAERNLAAAVDLFREFIASLSI